MSEETTNYGIPNTTLDTDAFPPQTGDLLGGYIARLSARVRDLESKFEDMDANENTMFERLNEVQKQVDHWFNNDVENRIVALEARIERLEQAAQPEPTAEPVCTTCGHDHGAHGRYGTRNLTKTKSIPSGEHRGDFFASGPGDVCARCGHVSASHNATWDTDTDSTKSWCNKKGCTCAGFLFAEPEPTAEPVCATCGHDEADHLITFGDKAQFLLCDGGTLGKPCRCTGYRPVATEG